METGFYGRIYWVQTEGDWSRPRVHCAGRQTERNHIPLRWTRADESVQEDGLLGADQNYVSRRVSRQLLHITTHFAWISATKSNQRTSATIYSIANRQLLSMIFQGHLF